ncbi:MAG: formimidoylglutamate deiminase [Phycisphaerae bacterium]|nr:MAG: formimidoylglutamate deiminase [Phycisphaerae bacterium]
MVPTNVIEADLTWFNGAFEPRIQVVTNSSGQIEQVGYLDLQPTMRLEGKALLPGMVNAHSHAFQRGLRGFGETFPKGAGSFWTWREAMYELVGCLEAEEFQNICRVAFEEMLRHGITTVGEFHYFHHGPTAPDLLFDDLVLAAAAEAGIRIVLLETFYAHGGFGEPLSGGQNRFATPDVTSFLAHVDSLREKYNSRTQTIGLAAHSLRAAEPDEIAALSAYALEHDMVLHMHVEEQRQEIDACVKAHGVTPIELLSDRKLLNPSTTLVHCTHTKANVIQRIAETGASICICPTTEGNLGDGIANVPAMAEAKAAICLGTDSNARISMNEEMRWLEYVQRAHLETRGVVISDSGQNASALFECATIAGAKSLGIKAGKIASGTSADLIVIDTQGISLLGSTAETLLPAFILGADRGSITNTCVAGQWHEWR